MSSENSMSIEERLDRIESSLARIASAIDQAPDLISIATDSVDEFVVKASRNGADVDQRIKDSLALIGRLSDPNISGALNGLLDFVEQAPGLISIAADSFDEQVSIVNSGPVKLNDRITAGGKLLLRLSDPAMTDKIEGLLALADQAPGLISITVDTMDELMKSGALLDPDNMAFFKDAFSAIVDAKNETPARVGGFFGTLKAFRDSDRQKALGFFMNVIKKIGQKI